MNNEITIDDVKEFIRKYGYKYSIEIREELDKTRMFTDKQIDDEIKKNYDFYKKMADM